MTDEQLMDVLDCGRPEENRAALRQWFTDRAARANELALRLEGEARDKAEQSAQHRAAAIEFTKLAAALASTKNTGTGSEG